MTGRPLKYAVVRYNCMV